MFASRAAGIEVTNGGGGEITGNEIFEMSTATQSERLQAHERL